MAFASTSSSVLLLLLSSDRLHPTNAFAPLLWATRGRRMLSSSTTKARENLVPLRHAAPDEENNNNNPYQDPNYPELEFIDYSDPNYQVDQGMSDEFFDPTFNTEAAIEEMREERRLRNDEYQFETYYRNVLREGKEYLGEWTVYTTSTAFHGDESTTTPTTPMPPKFKKAKRNLKVISKGDKVIVDPNAKWRVDGEHLVHRETLVPASDTDAYLTTWNTQNGNDDDEGESNNDDDTQDSSTASSSSSVTKQLEELTAEMKRHEEEIMAKTYWPDQMSSFDFRGQQGNMCVGNGYTICTGLPLKSTNRSKKDHDGPFSELRTEVGIQFDSLRFRVKLDYSIKENDAVAEYPPLHLKSLIVCRETQDRWPRDGGKSQSLEDRAKGEALFGAPGAPGGLYDPPPVGSDEQAACYMMMDLEGSASVLFPYIMDQDPNAFGGNGWVTSLDWTPGYIRFQVDRKVLGGPKVKGLRTLELSEVQREDADTYRPRDGGQDMRQ